MNKQVTFNKSTPLIYAGAYFVAITLIFTLIIGVLVLLFEDGIGKKLLGAVVVVVAVIATYYLNTKYFNKVQVENALKLKVYLITAYLVIAGIIIW